MLRAACQAVPIYTTALIVLLCVHYALLVAGVTYVALHRMVVRRKLRIKPCCGCAPRGCASFLGDWCLLFWCLPCALCQARGPPSPHLHLYIYFGEWCLLFWCLPCALCQVRCPQAPTFICKITAASGACSSGACRARCARCVAPKAPLSSVNLLRRVVPALLVPAVRAVPGALPPRPHFHLYIYFGEWCLLFWCLPCALCQARGPQGPTFICEFTAASGACSSGACRARCARRVAPKAPLSSVNLLRRVVPALLVPAVRAVPGARPPRPHFHL